MTTPEHTPPADDPRFPPPPSGPQQPYGWAPHEGPYGGPAPGTGGLPPMPPARPPEPGAGVGTAALIFGICGLVLLPLCGLGVLFAIVAFILGIAGIVKNSGKGQAVAGLVLSVCTFVGAVAFAVFLYHYLTSTGLDACLLDETISSDPDRLRDCVMDVLSRHQ